MNKIIFSQHLRLCLLLIWVSCSQQKVVSTSTIHQCQKPLTEIPGLEKIEKKIDGKKVIGHVASYASTAGGYVADVVIYVGLFSVATLAICMPVAALASSNNATDACIDTLGLVVPVDRMGGSVPIGIKTYEATSNWRCADFDQVATAYIDVIKCHANNKENELALAHINQIKNQQGVYRCLKSERKNEIDLLSKIVSKGEGSVIGL